jgi:LysR family transcriptional regulator, carnitine catabolism transcriptional activator
MLMACFKEENQLDHQEIMPPFHQIPKSLFAHLQSFVVVAELMNFRLAADALGRTQPAITAQINQLEGYLGRTLLERTTRSVKLTPAGAHLLDRAKRVLSESHQLVADMRSNRYSAPNQILVSLAPTIAANLIPGCLTRFEKSSPSVRVLISEHLGPEMFEALQNNDVEFGIGPYRRAPLGLMFETLFQQPLHLIIHDSHAIADRGYAKLSDLVDLQLLCAAPGTTAREVLDHALMTQGLMIQPRYEALQYQTLFVLASSQLGATVMPVVNHDLLKAMRLVALPFEDFPMQRAMGLITREGEQLSDVSSALLATLLEEASHKYTLTPLAEKLRSTKSHRLTDLIADEGVEHGNKF